MSTIKAINVQHPSSATINLVTDSSGNVSIGGGLTAAGTVAMGSSFMRNRIINGAMVIDQRNAGASVTPANNTYTLDRWKAYQTTASKFSVRQNAGSVTLPAGYINYLGVTSLSAYSVTSSDFYTVQQVIEGYNVSDLGWGTASAKTVTLSFLVYSSLTGTFGGSIFNQAGSRSYPFSYSVSSASTWTTISVTIPGDTTGTWLTDNSGGVQVAFGLGAGSTYTATANAWAAGLYTQPTSTVSVVGTNGATFYITGVQLEVGSVATPFEREIYSNTLEKCQRYYETSRLGSSSFGLSQTNLFISFNANYAAGRQFIVPKRAAPTVVVYSRNNTAATVSSVNTGGDIAAGNCAATQIGLMGWWSTNNNSGTYASAGGYECGYTADAEL